MAGESSEVAGGWLILPSPPLLVYRPCGGTEGVRIDGKLTKRRCEGGGGGGCGGAATARPWEVPALCWRMVVLACSLVQPEAVTAAYEILSSSPFVCPPYSLMPAEKSVIVYSGRIVWLRWMIGRFWRPGAHQSSVWARMGGRKSRTRSRGQMARPAERDDRAGRC